MTATTDLAALIARRNAARRDIMNTNRGETIRVCANPLTKIPEIVYPESELGGATATLYAWNQATGRYMSIAGA
jgi:hypothetical protein